MTCTIYHTELEGGRWVAVCDLFPGWKHLSEGQDKPGAETSLKRHASRRMRFTHMGWDGKTV